MRVSTRGPAEIVEGSSCTAAAECPMPAGPCMLAACLAGECAIVPAPDGLLSQEQQAEGDCQQLYCDGRGQVASFPAGEDLPPDDGNPCTEPVCEGSKPRRVPRPAGTPCADAGVCNGAGVCGECLPDARQCREGGLRRCDRNGHWGGPGPCPEAAPICAEDRCVAVAELALGARHGCARFENGSVRCWGSDEAGQMGQQGPDAARPAPWDPAAPAAAVGAGHACVLGTGGSVSCWGQNDHGQLGGGSFAPAAAPVAVKIDGAVEIAVGRWHTCALGREGKVFCWGRGDRGQLGGGKPLSQRGAGKQAAAAGSESAATAPLAAAPSQPRPVEVSWPGRVRSLWAGGDLSCLRADAGPLACFGSAPAAPPPPDGSARPGTKPAGPAVGKPSQVAGLGPSTHLALGEAHSCALQADGAIQCWGAGERGQLGDGGRADRSRPARVVGLQDAVALVCGRAHACALLRGGTVRCWGAGERGQLGSGAAEDAPLPVAVEGLGAARDLLAGDDFTCALEQSGGVRCWGAGDRGQLGTGATEDALRPVPVRW